MPTLLVVAHAPTPSCTRLLDAALAGAHDDAIEGVDVVVRPALEPDVDAVRAADALLLLTPANFGYMSGALKHFFDASFLHVGGSLDDGGSASTGRGGGTPYAVVVHGRYDTEGAVRSVLAITGALPWRQAAPVLEVVGEVGAEQEAAAYELGATLAALIAP